jgi:hypothetical protein
MKMTIAVVLGLLLLAGGLPAQAGKVNYLHGTTDVEVTWDIGKYLGHYKAYGGGRDDYASDLWLGPNGTGTVFVGGPTEKQVPQIGGGSLLEWHWYSPTKAKHKIFWGVLAKKDGSVAVTPDGSYIIFLVREQAQEDGEDWVDQFSLVTRDDKLKVLGGAWVWDEVLNK